MSFCKEYTGKFGTFYSDWAFDNDAQEKMKCNKETYDKLMDVLKVPDYGGNFIGNGDELFEYSRSSGYKKNCYTIKQKPDWMTMDEVALVVDYGNLCFGFNVGWNMIDIYTD